MFHPASHQTDVRPVLGEMLWIFSIVLAWRTWVTCLTNISSNTDRSHESFHFFTESFKWDGFGWLWARRFYNHDLAHGDSEATRQKCKTQGENFCLLGTRRKKWTAWSCRYIYIYIWFIYTHVYGLNMYILLYNIIQYFFLLAYRVY